MFPIKILNCCSVVLPITTSTLKVLVEGLLTYSLVIGHRSLGVVEYVRKTLQSREGSKIGMETNFSKREGFRILIWDSFIKFEKNKIL